PARRAGAAGVAPAGAERPSGRVLQGAADRRLGAVGARKVPARRTPGAAPEVTLLGEGARPEGGPPVASPAMSTPRRRFRDKVRGLVFPGWQRLVDERPEFQAQVNRVATDLHRYRWFHDHVDEFGLVPYLNEDLTDTARFLTWQPPGHFYSAIPSWSAVEERAGAAFDRTWRPLPGVPIDEDEHAALLAAFLPLWADLDGIAAEPDAWRYGLDNTAFNPADARVLYALLRHLRP
ncbi:hypothetical protein B7486_69380, partial [cyanobacterium TDX16]